MRESSKNGVVVFGAFGVGNFKTKLHKACVARLFERNDLVLDAETIADIARELVAKKTVAMTRVVGIDPGTVSIDICGMADGRLYLDRSWPTEEALANPDRLHRAAHRIGSSRSHRRALGVWASAASSGSGH